MTPVNLGGAAPLVIIKPERGLSTPLVYRAYDGGEKAPPSRIPEAISALQKGDYRALRELLHNALYPPAKGLLPELQELLSLLYKKGALFAAMTGSGSALFGVFGDEKSADQAAQQIREERNGLFTARANTCQEASTPLI